MGYASPGTNPTELIALAQEAERLGYDSAWTAEAWGTDAVTVLAWLGATTTTIKLGTGIMQMPARTPAMTAMTAATLDLMSGGRVLLGLGTSGPQVVEGWHGQPFGKPLGRTREYVEIVRAAIRRELVQHQGEHYEIPYRGDDATGLGMPLKLMLRPMRDRDPRLPRRDRAEERRARRRDRRRLAPGLGLAGEAGGCLRRAARRGQARLRRRRLRRPGGDLRRPPGRARLRQAAPGAVRRRHGREGPELLHDAGLRGTATSARRTRSRSSTSAGRRWRRSPPFPTRWWTRSRWSEAATGSPTASKRGRSRRVTTLLIQAHDRATLRTMAELVL